MKLNLKKKKKLIFVLYFNLCFIGCLFFSQVYASSENDFSWRIRGKRFFISDSKWIKSEKSKVHFFYDMDKKFVRLDTDWVQIENEKWKKKDLFWIKKEKINISR